MDDVDARVREVIALMLSGQWHAGLAIELAAKHGVSVKAAQDWSRQAGRYLRFARGDIEYVRERLLANLDFAGRLALEQERPDIRSFIAAQVEQGRLLRVAEPVVHEDDGDEQVPYDELEGLIQRAKANEHAGERTTQATDGRGGADRKGSSRTEEAGEGDEEG